VFSHFGSGTLACAATYLAEEFIVNPVLFHPEYDSLVEKGRSPRVFVDSRCKVTTPFDMILNQTFEAERALGKSHHGSCGKGVFETIKRHETPRFAIFMRDLAGSANDLHKKLLIIREHYTRTRMRVFLLACEKDHFSEQAKVIFENINTPNLIERFMEDCHLFMDRTTMVDDERFLRSGDIIFEGAQGLMLDQNNLKDFPFLTPSNTGLRNVKKILENLQPTYTTVRFVTRTYLTRHGPGPLPMENVDGFGIRDLTNDENRWQGALRFAPLDKDALYGRVSTEMARFGWNNTSAAIDVTHADVGDVPVMLENERKVKLRKGNEIAGHIVHPNKKYGHRDLHGFIASGPTANDVVEDR
jgi:adenylosuccinate synthase